MRSIRASKRGIESVVTVFVVLLMGACVGGPTEVDPAAQRALFDLSAFVDYQAERLARVPIRKRVRIGEIDETRRIDTLDWATELAPFAQANINKPAFLDSYTADSTRGTDGELTIKYAAIDSALKVQRLRVVCSGDCDYGKVQAIDIYTHFESVIAATEQRLSWKPAGYEVYSRQHTMFADPYELFLSGQPLRVLD